MKQGSKEEKLMSQILNFTLTPGSGAGMVKSDSYDGEFRLETKSTSKKSISVQTAVWKKIEREAMISGKIPLYGLDIAGLQLIVSDIHTFNWLKNERDHLRGIIAELMLLAKSSGIPTPLLEKIEEVL